MDPKANRKFISSLNTGGADDVDGQAVLINGATKVLGVGTVTDAHPSELLSISVSLPGLVKSLGGGEAERSYRGLSVGHAKEEIMVKLIAVLAMVSTIAKLNNGNTRRRGRGGTRRAGRATRTRRTRRRRRRGISGTVRSKTRRTSSGRRGRRVSSRRTCRRVTRENRRFGKRQS